MWWIFLQRAGGLGEPFLAHLWVGVCGIPFQHIFRCRSCLELGGVKSNTVPVCRTWTRQKLPLWFQTEVV